LASVSAGCVLIVAKQSHALRSMLLHARPTTSTAVQFGITPGNAAAESHLAGRVPRYGSDLRRKTRGHYVPLSF
jgi:hypothetical protein